MHFILSCSKTGKKSCLLILILFQVLLLLTGFFLKAKEEKHNCFGLDYDKILELIVSKEFNNNVVNSLKTNNVIHHKHSFQVL